jgi:orf22
LAEFWSNSDRGFRLRLWVDQVSQDKVANTSQVRFQLAILNTAATFASYSCSAFIDFDGGRRLNWSGSPNMTSQNSTIMLIDETVTVNHGDDGKKIFGFMARFIGGGGYSPNTLEIGGNSFTLTDLQRSSNLKVSSAVFGREATITIDRQNPTFKHTIRYQIGDSSGTIASNVDTSATWTIPLDLINKFTNTVNAQGTILVDSYLQGSKIGTQSTTINISVPDSVKPTLTGLTLVDTNETVRRLLPENNFIQVMSNIRADFSGASGAYGSTITGYYAEIAGRNQSVNSNGATFGMMNYSGQAVVRARVSDSRGRWSDFKEVNINVLEYFAPSLKFDVTRVGATSSTLQVLRNANIAPLTVNGVQKNTMRLTFKVTPYGKDSYTTDTGPASGDWAGVSSLVNSSANLAGVYAANKSWHILAVLEDKFTYTSFKLDVPVESVALSYDQSGLGVAKIRERGALDVAGDIYANNSQIQQYQLTSNNGAPKWIDGKPNVTNANWLDQPGQYYIDKAAPGNPNGQLGYLFHYSNYGKNTDGFKEAIQIFWGNNGQLFFRHHRWSKKIDDWEPWKEFAKNENTNLINTGWKSAGYTNSYYKRAGDVLTIKYDFAGNGEAITFATLPKEVLTAPQNYMLTIAVWDADGTANSHVQIDKGGNTLTALKTKAGSNYFGQLTIML